MTTPTPGTVTVRRWPVNDPLTDRIAEFEREREESRQRIHELAARVAGLDAQIDALRSGVRPAEPLAKLKLADAVEQVMRTEGRVMSPTGIHEALIAGGRHDQPTSIGGTLQYLKRRGRVVSLGRSKWQSTA
jgi:hypothetical protein